MKLLFIDESKRQQNRNNKLFFIQVGVMVDKDSLLTIEKGIEVIKQEYNLNGLKGLRGRIPRETKLEVTQKLCTLLSENNVKILSSVLGNVAMRSYRRIEDSYCDAISFIVERFFINLNQEGKTGLMIHDQIDGDVERNLKREMHKVISTENFRCRSRDIPYINRIYPSMVFSNEDHSNLLQVTDLIATSLQSAIWQTRNEDETEISFNPNQLYELNEYLNAYWPLFVKDGRDNVNGYGIKVWW